MQRIDCEMNEHETSVVGPSPARPASVRPAPSANARVTGRGRDGFGEIAPWAELSARVPRGLQIPRWLGATVAGAVAAGPLLGLATRGASWQLRAARSIFFGAAFGYLTTSLVDFGEHFRMEKEVTGRYLRAAVVPLGETLNHAGTIATVVTSLAVARPITRSRVREAWTLLAPALFLALGWRDELVYHRKRATHREDIMHTVSHLAAGVMWTALYTMRALDRRTRRARARRRRAG